MQYYHVRPICEGSGVPGSDTM